ncbi:hypothetical protein ACJJI5_12405 [Microbulbifer sp. EKSA008]|uniref:hypothetical protein n=1 Tax=unclassified Microbulbifer TaxID=2619833 RepID=UPI0040394BCE
MIQIKTKVDDGPGSVRLCSTCAGTGIDQQWRVCDGCAGAGILVDNPAMSDLQLTIFANEVQPHRQYLASINTDLVNQDPKQTESVMAATRHSHSKGTREYRKKNRQEKVDCQVKHLISIHKSPLLINKLSQP